MARVLVVDDTPDTVRLLAHLMTKQGHEVFKARGGREALATAQAVRPDAVLLDVMMPGMDGIEVCRRLKSNPETKTTQIILLTAKDTDEDVVTGLDAGADDYLKKPFNKTVLAARLRAALRTKEYHDTILQINESLLAEIAQRKAAEERVREQSLAIHSAHQEVISRLVGASMWRDEETGMHVKRTGLLSGIMAKAIGWSSADVELIQLAAPLHDVGKIGIPDAILRKPGKLSVEEFEIMRTHTLIGAKMLANSEAPMLRLAREIALNHHERWDGAGYPFGIADANIPESARILAIIDVYDALTHDRVYRPALPEDEAIEILRKGAGSHFDSLLLATFFTQLPEIRRVAQENPDEQAEELAPGLPCAVGSPCSSADCTFVPAGTMS
jgi:putative two-component system response regulator